MVIGIHSRRGEALAFYRVFLLMLQFFLADAAWGYALFNINVEDSLVYDIVESSEFAYKETLSIKPLSYEKALRLSDPVTLNRLELLASKKFPISSFSISSYYSNEDNTFLEGQGGLDLWRGWNTFVLMDGFIPYGENLILYYEPWLRSYSDEVKGGLHRGYIKWRIGKFSLLGGKDLVNIGPGYYGQILSNNPEPFWMVRLQTEESLRFLGKWDFLVLKGWLKEDRLDRDNPQVFAMTFSYKPVDILEISGTRGIFYGGEGRPGYKLTEYPKLIIGSEENVPGSKYDNDGYGQLDFTLYLPLKKIFPEVRTFKLYYSKAGTDIKAWWQEENRGEFDFFDGWLPIGFDFLSSSKMVGALLSTEDHILRIEYIDIHPNFYIHHFYPVEGYTYHNLSLGYPWGRDLKSIFFKHVYFIKENLLFQYKVGYYGPNKDIRKMKAYYGEGSLNIILKRGPLKNINIQPLLRFERLNDYDTNPLINQFSNKGIDRDIYFLGLSVKWLL